MRILWLAPVHFDAQQDVHPAPWISTLARKLTDEHGVSLSILNYEPRLPEAEISFEREGITYTFLKTPVPKLDHLGFFKKRVSVLKSYLKKNRSAFDMIHIHGSEHQYEAAVSGTGIPSVLSMQGVMGECLKRLKDKWNYTHLSWWMSAMYEKKFVPKMTDFICRTTFDSGFVRENNQAAVIHENWEMIRPQFFQELGAEQPEKLLYMGGTHPIKGIELMLPAFDLIRQKADVRLMVLGKVDRQMVNRIIADNELVHIGKDDIEFLGFQDVDGVVNAMKESYAMVHTSLIDNSPNSVCEAQVGGLPVVSTNVGGIASLIDDRRTGMLTALEPRDIATKMLELINDPALRTSIQRASRSVARARHDADHIAHKTMEIYAKVMAPDYLTSR